MRSRWGLVLTSFLDRLIVSLDVLHEEEVALWMRMHPTPGPAGPTVGPGLGGIENEYEKFSQDRDWMPRVVLMAKTTYVWLDQLSKRYGRWIHRLDEIPDEELDTLSRPRLHGPVADRPVGAQPGLATHQAVARQPRGRGFRLLADGLHDRRRPGRRGGLRAAAQPLPARGIRLASDMVPNHMGIDSRWVMEHPDWFLSTARRAVPRLQFTGGNLSDDERVGDPDRGPLLGRDGRRGRVQARPDRWTGEVRYIYHGNDGTSMPWNDTAQLDYLRPDVREAVIQTILASPGASRSSASTPP
jgi:hypothetical protein